MKSICLITALILLVAAPLTILAAEDGAAVYKSAKCVACHGDNGEGKPAMKMPPVKGTTMTAEQIVEYLTKGQADKKFPHNKPAAGVNEDQAKAVADYVKSLK